MHNVITIIQMNSCKIPKFRKALSKWIVNISSGRPRAEEQVLLDFTVLYLQKNVGVGCTFHSRVGLESGCEC